MYEYDEDGEGGGRSTGQKVGLAIGVVAIAALGWFVVKPQLLGGDDDASGVGHPGGGLVVDRGGEPTRRTSATTTTTTTEATETSRKSTTTTAADAATATTASETTTTTAAEPATTAAPTTTPPAAADPPTYDTLPDGSPAPVIALFDAAQITLTGAVPDQAAKDRLQALAIANAKPGQGNVVNFLTINPAVPRNVGVRVVELTSARFPEGSAEVLPEHARELDRIASIMNALPT